MPLLRENQPIQIGSLAGGVGSTAEQKEFVRRNAPQQAAAQAPQQYGMQPIQQPSMQQALAQPDVKQAPMQQYGGQQQFSVYDIPEEMQPFPTRYDAKGKPLGTYDFNTAAGKIMFARNKGQTDEQIAQGLAGASPDIKAALESGMQPSELVNTVVQNDIQQIAQRANRFGMPEPKNIDEWIALQEYQRTGQKPKDLAERKFEWEQKQAGQEMGIEQREEQKQQESKIGELRQKLGTIDRILGDEGALSGAVGPNRLARLDPLSAFTGQKEDFIADVKLLTDKDTMDTLLNLKERGGTLGALSEGEKQMLKQAASKIGSWEAGGGYDVSEEDFKKELNRLRDLTETAINRAGGQVGGTAGQSDYNSLQPGEVVYNEQGQAGRVESDGSITPL